MADALTTLRLFTEVVADTGDLEAIRLYQPLDATTNPALLLKASKMKSGEPLVRQALEWAKEHSTDKDQRVVDTADKLLVTLALEILTIVPGVVSIELDARLSYDTQASIDKARRLIEICRQAGGVKASERILIKLASTWQGVQAARILESEGIHCNLTLLFSFAQARACAEAGVYMISPFVGRIFDWYKRNSAAGAAALTKDPGVEFVTRVYHYYKSHGYRTVIMGASFRNIDQIISLAGCDKLTIDPNLLRAMAESNREVGVNLHYEGLIMEPDRPLSEADFYWLHNQDQMALQQLADGICQFALAQEELEKLLLAQL